MQPTDRHRSAAPLDGGGLCGRTDEGEHGGRDRSSGDDDGREDVTSSFEDQHVVVVGGASGMGAATAATAAELGARVTVMDVQDPPISSTAGLGWEKRLDLIDEVLGLGDWDAQQRWIDDHPDLESYVFTKQAVCAYVSARGGALLARGVRINAVLSRPTATPLARANADTWLTFGARYREAAGVPTSSRSSRRTACCSCAAPPPAASPAPPS